MDEFEKYIQSKQRELDLWKARPELWDRIDREVNPKSFRPPVWKQVVKIAAMFVLPIGVAIMLLLLPGRMNQSNDEIAKIELKDVSPETAEAESWYDYLISVKLEELNASTILTDQEKEEVLETLDELDQEYLILKSELVENISNEIVLNAMIENQRRKLDLLEQVLEQISDEPINTDEDEDEIYS